MSINKSGFSKKWLERLGAMAACFGVAGMIHSGVGADDALAAAMQARGEKWRYVRLPDCAAGEDIAEEQCGHAVVTNAEGRNASMNCGNAGLDFKFDPMPPVTAYASRAGALVVDGKSFATNWSCFPGEGCSHILGTAEYEALRRGTDVTIMVEGRAFATLSLSGSMAATEPLKACL